jgi:transcriptional regulator with XRE-family HTH domain
MELVQILGRNVRCLRTDRGWSQEKLAFECEMKRSYLSDLERGTRNPSIKAVERLSKALNVPASELLAL